MHSLKKPRRKVILSRLSFQFRYAALRRVIFIRQNFVQEIEFASKLRSVIGLASRFFEESELLPSLILNVESFRIRSADNSKIPAGQTLSPSAHRVWLHVLFQAVPSGYR